MGAGPDTTVPWVFDSSRLTLEVLWRLLGLRVHGLENIPKEGAAIFAINHVSNLDPLLAGTIIARVRRFRGIGKKELFQMPFVGTYLRAMGSFPVDRERGDTGALKQALEILERGDLFLMAPEGTRVKAGRPRTPKAGVGFLAQRTGVPVIPIRVHGTDQPPYFGRLWVRIGEPIRFQSQHEDPLELRAAHQRFADELMARIYSFKE